MLLILLCACLPGRPAGPGRKQTTPQVLMREDREKNISHFRGLYLRWKNVVMCLCTYLLYLVTSRAPHRCHTNLVNLVGVTQPTEQVFVREERGRIVSHTHGVCLGWQNIQLHCPLNRWCRKIHVQLYLYIHRHSYLVDLIGSRRPQVFVRENRERMLRVSHTHGVCLGWQYVQLILCVF